jgi:hypothetical protein
MTSNQSSTYPHTLMIEAGDSRNTEPKKKGIIRIEHFEMHLYIRR